MKKITIVALALLLLIGCVPTPTEEAVVRKDDMNAATAAHSESEPAQDLSQIPTHLSLTEHPQQHVTVTVDADVVLERDARFPLLEVEPLDTLHDPAFYRSLKEAVCPDGTLYEQWQRTKDEVGEQLQAALSYHGQAGSQVDADVLKDVHIPMMEEEYRNAPETADKHRHDDAAGFENNRQYFIEKPSGEVAWLYVSGVNGGSWAAKDRMSYVPEDSLEPEDEPIAEPEISEREAIETGDAFLRRMGVECNALSGTKKGFTFFNYERGESIWLLYYTRRIDRTRSIDPNGVDSYSPPVSPASTVGAPWNIEGMTLGVGPDGILFVEWRGLTKTAKVLVDNAALLRFDELVRRAVGQLGFTYAFVTQNGADPIDMEVRVQRIELVYALLCEKDRYGVGVYTPVWEITYTTANLPEQVQQLYLSALDGGAVEPRMTREELMRSAA